VTAVTDREREADTVGAADEATWRLIIEDARGGAWNMAVDEALIEAVDAGTSPGVVRFYRWRPACLSLGFSQPFAVADAAFCAANGVSLVRRPTGGRAVLHQHELTYSVAAPLGRGRFGTDLQAVYRDICRALVAGLRQAGVPAGLAGAPAGGMTNPTAAVPCFIGPAAGEVVANGRKLVGSAMRKIGNSILQHGSILEGWDGRLQAGCLGLADDRALRAAVVTLAELLGAVPEPATLIAALKAGFSATLGVVFEGSTLTDAERARAALLARERYGHRRFLVERSRDVPDRALDMAAPDR